MFLSFFTLAPLAPSAQSNPMEYTQGPLWMVLVLLVTLLGVFAWIWLTRREEEAASPDIETNDPVTTEPSSNSGLNRVATSALATAEAVAASVEEHAADVRENIETAIEERQTEPASATVDDLTRVEGIGPKIDAVLKEAGIHTYQQLASATVDTLYKIVRDEAKIRVAVPDTWPEQAALAAEGKWDELDALQNELKGGRRV